MKNLKIILLALFGFIIFLGFASWGQMGQNSFAIEYKIGPKDLLEIKVLDMPELSNLTIRVSEDGTITLPLIGNLLISGMTKDEIEKLITKYVEAKYIKNPQVTIFIKEYQSQRVSVIGAVNKPGTYQLLGRVTILDIISQAGGFQDNASNEIVVLRKSTTGPGAIIRINIVDLTINGDEKLNIPLQAGDLINIPNDKNITIYVFGAVKNPGAIQILQSKQVNVVKAIAQAGGLSDSGSYSGITIKRSLKDGKELNIVVNLKEIINGKKPNIILQDGDIIFIKESIF
jgi:polysaccharide export outer membrane protein